MSIITMMDRLEEENERLEQKLEEQSRVVKSVIESLEWHAGHAARFRHYGDESIYTFLANALKGVVE